MEQAGLRVATVETDTVRKTVERIAHVLEQEDAQAFFVGGCVRDLLLGRPLHDLDLVVAQEALGLAHRLARALGGAFVLLDEDNAIARIVLRARKGRARCTVDVAAMRGGDLHADLAARDLTINAMALPVEALRSALPGDLAEERVIDPFGGRADLGRRLLRALGPEAFLQDPLRTLRVVRLAAELDFAVDPDTARWAKEAAPHLWRVSWERIRDEVARLLRCPRAARFLPLLDAYGLLGQVFPEVEAGREEEALEHLWTVVGSLEAVVLQLEGAAGHGDAPDLAIDVPDPGDLRRRLDVALSDDRTGLFVVKLAALLHHVRPPEVVRRAGRRLRLSEREVRALVTAVVRPEAEALWEGREISPRAVYRFFRACYPIPEAVLLLDLVERLAHGQGPRRDTVLRVQAVLRLSQEQREVVVDPPRLVDGQALMAALGLPPGPWIGRLLEGIREAQAAGEVRTRDEALAWARAALRSTPQSGMTVPQ
ncbi:MAG: hypothetical protein ACP5SI_01200 [Chloroflexia bacterium]